jgi:nucleoside-diphosphate-sugar epimerase
MAAKKAIVFGSAGFIGCHFLKRLAADRRYESLYSVDIAEPRLPGDLVGFGNDC